MRGLVRDYNYWTQHCNTLNDCPTSTQFSLHFPTLINKNYWWKNIVDLKIIEQLFFFFASPVFGCLKIKEKNIQKEKFLFGKNQSGLFYLVFFFAFFFLEKHTKLWLFIELLKLFLLFFLLNKRFCGFGINKKNKKNEFVGILNAVLEFWLNLKIANWLNVYCVWHNWCKMIDQ